MLDNRPYSYEMAILVLSKHMVINPRLSIIEAYTILKEENILESTTKPFPKRVVKEMMEEIRNSWAQESLEEVVDARRRQLREIAHIKQQLHKKGDYRTLEKYINLEAKLTGTAEKQSKPGDKQPNVPRFTAQEFIALLEEGRRQNAMLIESNDVTVNDLMTSFEQE